MQTALEALVEARSLIGRPEKWWDGSGDTPLNRMCLHQAVAAALHKLQAGQRDPGAVREVYCALSELSGGYSETFVFNDSHSHAEVLSLLDRAMEIVRARGQASA